MHSCYKASEISKQATLFLDGQSFAGKTSEGVAKSSSGNFFDNDIAFHRNPEAPFFQVGDGKGHRDPTQSKMIGCNPCPLSRPATKQIYECIRKSPTAMLL